MRAFWLALGFLTRLPVMRVEVDETTAGRAVLYYPLVGLVLGALLAALGWMLTKQDERLAAALVLVAWVWLSGALHLDGLADSADAWLGGHGERDRMLAIMKDPACGPAAVVVVTTVLIAKFAALDVLIEARDWLALLLVPMLSRAGVVLLFLTTPYVRPQGIGEAQARHLPRRTAAVVIVVAVSLLPVWMGGRGLAALLAAAGGFWWLRRLLLKRLGGTTGDTAGAMIELIELIALAAVALIS